MKTPLARIALTRYNASVLKAILQTAAREHADNRAHYAYRLARCKRGTSKYQAYEKELDYERIRHAEAVELLEYVERAIARTWKLANDEPNA